MNAFDARATPRGSKASKFHCAAAFTALADVYDALTSRRVYKAAITHEIARSMILKDSGTHFDPDV